MIALKAARIGICVHLVSFAVSIAVADQWCSDRRSDRYQCSTTIFFNSNDRSASSVFSSKLECRSKSNAFIGEDTPQINFVVKIGAAQNDSVRLRVEIDCSNWSICCEKSIIDRFASAFQFSQSFSSSNSSLGELKSLAFDQTSQNSSSSLTCLCHVPESIAIVEKQLRCDNRRCLIGQRKTPIYYENRLQYVEAGCILAFADISEPHQFCAFADLSISIIDNNNNNNDYEYWDQIFLNFKFNSADANQFRFLGIRRDRDFGNDLDRVRFLIYDVFALMKESTFISAELHQTADQQNNYGRFVRSSIFEHALILLIGILTSITI